MKRILRLLSLFLFFIYATVSAQSKFEKGYFIDNNNQKIECLIKNRDWKSAPKKFEYKLADTDQEQTIQVVNITELVIYDYCKYIKAKVEIDRTSNNIKDLDANSNPVWIEETLLLTVLMEGKASLYAYYEGSLQRFFYRQLSNAPIKQFIYKLYQPENMSVKKYLVNAQFHQQLRLDLPCEAVGEEQIQKMSYSERSLMDYFSLYHQSINEALVDYTPKNPKEYWHFNLILGLNHTSLSYTDTDLEFIDFGSKVSVALGAEAEIIVPYTQKRLTFLLSPNLQLLEGSTLFNNVRRVGFQFYAINMPVGFRFYQPISPNLKIFANLGYVFEFPINAYVERNSVVSYKISVKEPDFLKNLSIGMGAFYKKFGGEFRYYGTRGVLGYDPKASSSFSKISFLLSYRLF